MVMPLRAFGRDIVLMRSAGGTARIFDAHCPHVGAHLGYGGRVVGDLLECPFHGWRFDDRGQCVSVPKARGVPRASIRVWHLQEVNGVVMTWFDPDGGRPRWAMPELPELSFADWTGFHQGRHWTIRTHVQELVENGMDLAHFPHVHGQQSSGAESLALEIQGPTLIHHTVQHHNIFGIGQRLGWRVTGTLDITCYALGCAVNRARIREGISLDYCVVFYFLPIDRDHVAVHSYYSMRRKGLLTVPLLRLAMRDGSHTIDQDVPIWENKVFWERPHLCSNDGPIMRFRKWAQQFYSAGATERSDASDTCSSYPGIASSASQDHG